LLRPGTMVGVANWRDAGKIAFALGPDVTVICLNRDQRQFGFTNPADRWVGSDMLLLVVDHPDNVIASLRPMFRTIEEHQPSAVTLWSRELKPVTVATGIDFRPER
jgi:hypothetical protein